MTGRSFDAQKRMKALTTKAVQTYHASRHAILRLRGHGAWENVLQVLDERKDIRDAASDIFAADFSRDLVAVEDDRPASSAHAELKRKRTQHGLKTADTIFSSSTNFMFTWIWKIDGVFADVNEDEMDGLIRIEWQKSRARLARAREHVQMLKDSRERTLLSLEYEAKTWIARASGWTDTSPELAEGIASYCHSQAAGRRGLAAKFKALWATKAWHGHPRVADRIDLQEDADSDSEGEDDEASPMQDSSARDLTDFSLTRPGMRDQAPAEQDST